MPRAKRYFLPGFLWHITHRCHKKEFLFKFARDRECWLGWLFEAKRCYGLCVLNYMVTSNPIHLLVKDTNQHVIAKSLQLTAGRTAQEYNLRKQRKGAFWENRFCAKVSIFVGTSSRATFAGSMQVFEAAPRRGGYIIYVGRRLRALPLDLTVREHCIRSE
jgi:REP element-mobilizing transposase RayT